MPCSRIAHILLTPARTQFKHCSHLVRTLQAPVDIMGVVVGLGSVGTIKRKTSGEELSRRDVTLVDQVWTQWAGGQGIV